MKKNRLSLMIVLMGVFSFGTVMAEGPAAPAALVPGAGQNPTQESASAPAPATSSITVIRADHGDIRSRPSRWPLWTLPN